MGELGEIAWSGSYLGIRAKLLLQRPIFYRVRTEFRLIPDGKLFRGLCVAWASVGENWLICVIVHQHCV